MGQKRDFLLIDQLRGGLLGSLAVGLAFPRAVDAVAADAFRVSVVQSLEGVAIDDGDDRAGEICRDSCAGKQEIESAAQTVSLRVMPAGFESLYEEPLPALLMDVDSIEGKLLRCDECDSNETDQMTVANILWGHGGLVTGHEKGPPGFVSLEGL